jgi:hypothetical protein
MTARALVTLPDNLMDIVDSLSDVLAEKGVIIQEDWEEKIKENLSAK